MTQDQKQNEAPRSKYYSKLIVFLLFPFLASCKHNFLDTPIFEKLSSSYTNIHFSNEIVEDSIHNFLNFSNIYNGSGVGVGDFNNDGLLDIFFGGGLESSRLYINQGDFKFKDVTEQTGLITDRWIAGVSVVDINADGWNDIYLSVTGDGSSVKLKNLLYINNGFDPDNSSSEITFNESAQKYGIDDSAHCTHASFFDYDRDGDLDLFLILNPPDLKREPVNMFRPKKMDGSASSTDKLYRNNVIGSKAESITNIKELQFTNVSEEAGILHEGYSLGCNVSDLNGDDWPDIYITNDFMPNDVLYINNRDGTFTNQAAKMLKHTSYASMGMDIADINNDALPEIFVLDMLPEDNYRQKTMVITGDYDRFHKALELGYEAQYTRNTLQLNNGDGTFSEVGQMYNVHKTDWSWSALLADYDNDGFRDLFVTNGYKRDLGNLDYMMQSDPDIFGSREARKERKLARILEQPGAKVANYIFKNQNGTSFVEKSKDWGIDDLSYSCGAAFADLDLDGDLDLVVNNVGQEATIYKNRAIELTQNHYLKVKLKGQKANPSAFGTKVWLYYRGGKMQYAEQTIYRGYESSVDPTLHFGLGSISLIDSVKVIFPDGKSLVLKDIAADTLLQLNNRDADLQQKKTTRGIDHQFFVEASHSYGLNYLHTEDDQVDFKEQPLLPHQHSRLGPAMSIGDINNDGLEDLFIGGSAGMPATWCIQTIEAGFLMKKWTLDSIYEDTNSLFIDVDRDGDLDLYVCSGGVISIDMDGIYQDRIYANDGKGNFLLRANALPEMPTSTMALASTDFDKDGDLDIFVGGRVRPGDYPDIPTSYLLENRNGILHNVTKEIAPALASIGMVTDAIWTDYDNDNDQDLMLAGEWMPITLLENENGKLNPPKEISYSNGWWNSLAEGDFDNDGDIDYLAGNLGYNTNYRASIAEPFSIYANDYDNNGTIDPILCQYIDGVEQAIATRDKLVEQIPAIIRRLDTYGKYAQTPFEEMFKGSEWEGMQILRSYQFASCYIENLGNGQFNLKPLSREMQMAPIHKFLVDDVNEDGFLDALVVGNDYSTEITIGRYDAFTGAILLGKGNGEFSVKRGGEIGFVADKNARNLIEIESDGESLILIGNNSDSLQIFNTKL